MKIIKVDNFGRESVADVLIVENVDKFWGGRIIQLLNESEHDDSESYFDLVDDDRVLWRGMEELV